MAICIAARERRIPIPVDGEVVTLILRQPTEKEHAAFLASRFVREGNKTKTNLWPARAAFVKELLVGIENATWQTADGAFKDLFRDPMTAEDLAYLSGVLGREVQSWKDVVPQHLLSTAATTFEEGALEGN